jgi:exosortase/archaeosortase family protein
MKPSNTSNAAKNKYNNNSSWRYLLLFFVIFISLCSIYFYQISNRSNFIVFYFTELANSVCSPLQAMDSSVQCNRDIIMYNNSPALAIVGGCDGLAFVILILAAVLPYSRPLKQKLFGLLILIPLLLGINWLRIIILALLRFYANNYFDVIHIYVFQPTMILLTIIGFALWIIYSEKHA